MTSFRSIDQALGFALKKLKPAIDASLGSAVLDAVRAEEVAQIAQNVYMAYGSNEDGEPVRYRRRYADGGLGDESNVKGRVSGGTLTVNNETQSNTDYGGNSGLLAPIIEFGGPYQYSKGKNTFGDFHQPRGFTQETADALAASNAHIEALGSGLSAQGFRVQR